MQIMPSTWNWIREKFTIILEFEFELAHVGISVFSVCLTQSTGAVHSADQSTQTRKIFWYLWCFFLLLVTSIVWVAFECESESVIGTFDKTPILFKISHIFQISSIWMWIVCTLALSSIYGHKHLNDVASYHIIDTLRIVIDFGRVVIMKFRNDIETEIGDDAFDPCVAMTITVDRFPYCSVDYGERKVKHTYA